MGAKHIVLLSLEGTCLAARPLRLDSPLGFQSVSATNWLQNYKKTLIIKKCLFATSEFAQAFTEAFLLMNHEASVVSHAYTLSDCTSRHGTAYSYMAFLSFCKPESSVPWPVQTNAMAFDTPLSCGRNNHFQTMRNKPYAF